MFSIETKRFFILCPNIVSVFLIMLLSVCHLNLVISSYYKYIYLSIYLSISFDSYLSINLSIYLSLCRFIDRSLLSLHLRISFLSLIISAFRPSHSSVFLMSGSKKDPKYITAFNYPTPVPITGCGTRSIL